MPVRESPVNPDSSRPSAANPEAASNATQPDQPLLPNPVPTTQRPSLAPMSIAHMLRFQQSIGNHALSNRLSRLHQPAPNATSHMQILIDDAMPPQSHQMTKSQFLQALRSEVTILAQQILGPIGLARDDCPDLDYWLTYYQGKDAAYIEAAMSRYAPSAKTATDSAQYISLIVARIKQGLEHHVATGSLDIDPEPRPMPPAGHAAPSVQRMPMIQRDLFRGAATTPDQSEEQGTALEETRKTVEEMIDILSSLATQPHLQTISFTNCRLPAGWSTQAFSHIRALSSLKIYSCSGPPPADHLSGLVALRSLKILDLTRAEFMDAACYENLGRMVQLETLILDRTITNEKSPDQNDRRAEEGIVRTSVILHSNVVNALIQLLRGGGLKNLQLRWCSALSETDKEQLQFEAAAHGCTLLLS